MITSIRLQDFKGHRDTNVPLGRFSVLVGPNGSGKTSVLEALWLQSQFARRQVAQVLTGDWSAGDLLRRGAEGPIILTSVGTRAGENWSTRTEIKPGSANLVWNSGAGERSTGPISDYAFCDFVPEIVLATGPAALYKLNAERISVAAYSDQPSPEIDRDGTNTAVALAAIKLGYDEAFDRIEEEMRRLIPNVERVRIRQAQVQRPIRVSPTQMENVVGSKIFFDFRGASGVPAHAASEGTLITLALLTALHGPNRPNILLLDDFDQSLHPQAQIELVRLIKRLLDQLPNIQIVATTHSPYVLDELDLQDVHAFALRDDGSVAVKCLSEHPEAEKMNGALSAGQLWSLDPEKNWVLEKAS
jgi:predicted ATPase